MRKWMRLAVCCGILWSLLWCGTLISDRLRLNSEVIRLHVVANSNSEEDQLIKLRVRDAVTDYLSQALELMDDAQSAKRFLQENLDQLRQIAQDVLDDAGIDMTAAVSFCDEAFATRQYDTFTMPAGIYNALRITIGSGQGKNWWCVVFPDLCMGTACGEFEAAAAGAGFPDSLIGALERKNGYEIRFFLLDVLGKLENIFLAG